jgi:O-antigen/teichoic acid export membrane protein
MGRIIRGLAANLVGNGVTLLIQLVSVPVLLANWGVPTYGEWLILSAIPTYLALSDLSFSTVAGNSMTMLVAKGDRAGAVALGRQVWSTVTLITGLAVLAAILIAIAFSDLFRNGTAIAASEVRLILAALLLQVAIGNQYGVLDAWYRAGGRYPLGMALRQFGRLLEFGAIVVVVILGGSPAAAAIAFLGASAVGFGISWFVLHMAVTWATFRPVRPQLVAIRHLIGPGLAFIAFPASNAISIQGFTIVVGSILGSPALVVFATTRTATRVALQVLISINMSIWPELSRSIGSGHFEEARTIQRRAVQLAVIASATLMIALFALGPAAVRWWTRGIVDPPLPLLGVLAVVIVANTFWFTLTTALVATNRHARMAVVYLVSSAVALLLAIPLSSAVGLIGTAVALLAIDVGMIVYVLPASLRVVEDTPREFLRALLDLPGAVRTIARGAMTLKARYAGILGRPDKNTTDE